MPARLDARQIASLGLLILGVLLLIEELGVPVAGVTWPLVMAVVGVAVIWRQLDEEQERRVREVAARIPGQPLETIVAGRTAWLRIGVGAVFVLAGAGAFLALAGAFPALRQGVLGFMVIVTGLALIFGPWFVRLGRELADERRRRIRSEERATVAAHLHDGVLQTLALIQRAADDPAQVSRLARVQERELRRWLFGTEGDRQSTVAAAIRAIVEDVEHDYDVVVDEVVVGGSEAVTGSVEALVPAVREAVVNAAKHSGAERIDVYVELATERAAATVRDRGRGFELATVPADRHGLAHSITRRVESAGGRVTVRTGPGEGTEVEIEVPR